MKDRQKKLRLADISVNKFSREGYGIGSFQSPDGKEVVVEVPFAVPGDQVNVSLQKKRKGLCRGKLLELRTPSPDRIEPVCTHFGVCGGCRWQQISYEQQLHQKTQWILGHLQPYLSATTIVHPIIPCDPPWHYRNKVELTFSSDKAMHRYLGFIMQDSRGKVFNLEECHLVNGWMNLAVHAVQEWWSSSGLDAYHAMRNSGSLRTLTLREGQRTGDRMVILTVSGNADYALKQGQLTRFVECLREAIEPRDGKGRLAIFLCIQQIAKGQRTNFYEMHLYGPDHICEIIYLPSIEQTKKAYTFHISPKAFFQPNTRQAERLYARVMEMVQMPPDALVYDLYCGTGTLGICLAGHAKEVIGIELSPESVLDAQENININGLNNVEVRQGDAAKVLAALWEEERKRADIVVVDPPRAGLDSKALQHLLVMNAPQIAYVSCNPATQAKDLEPLVQAGYQLQAVQPVDQFPQTVHVENIVILTKFT
ncbi:MAG: 23S rRNA (uracil(1939)-C(5))-methyltransferase RlmD [Chlamydiales bacterium]